MQAFYLKNSSNIQQKTKPFQVWFLWQLLKLNTKNISL
ncbi:hypothetical protein AO366_1461 [Moraxella catarrhalis]|nr:hypothetical protein AO373_0157 [Moraxella catarrhalis]OAV33051.1 hypothetical protein AO366_1461 [Moraxella catarrhalis]